MIPSPTANETAFRIRPSMSSCETPRAASLASEIGLSTTAARDAELCEQLDVGLHRAGKAPHLGAEARVCDQPDRLCVLLRDAREAGLDPVDARVVEGARDRKLVLRREDDADGLLAVAEGRVVETDGRVRLRLERAPVQLARPQLVAVQGQGVLTIPSGKRQSRSGPSSVIRKLSSTRRPPPSGQYTPGSIASTIPASIVPVPAWCA